MKKLSLVIPCYNEESTLAGIVEEVLKIRSAELELELVVVDDCSNDSSRSVAESLAAKHPEVKLCLHERNRGKGAALRTGFLAATGDCVGIQDADVVFGSRYLRREDRIVLRWWHSTMNRFLTWLSNVFTDLDLTDMETCYKLFRREIIQKIAPRLKEDRFGFEPEVVAHVARLARKAGLRMAEVAVAYRPRTFLEGKKIGWRDGVRALWCILKYNLWG